MKPSAGISPHVGSLALDVRCLDDWPPLLDLGLVESAECFRRLLFAWEKLHAKIGEPLTNRPIGQRNHHRVTKLADDDQGAVKAPTIQRSYSCKRSRQSVSTLQSQSSRSTALMPLTEA
jgi:hypothetical protein